MNVVLLGVIVVVVYFAILHLAEPYLSRHTDRMMEYSANLWITLGGIALLAGYHQTRKQAARQQAEVALKLSEKWGEINEYLVENSENGRLLPLVKTLYGDPQPVNIEDPYVKLGIDYIIEKCYEMWVLNVGMDINLSLMNTRSDYTAIAEHNTSTKLSQDATQPVHILIGSIFVIPEFYLLLTRSNRFYPKAFTDYVKRCISLYREVKNPDTGRAGFKKGDVLSLEPGG